MTIQEALQKYKQKLQKNKINTSMLDTEIIIAYVLKKNRIYLLTNKKEKISQENIKKINELIKRRLNHEPIAYLTKQKYFYSLKFYVNKNVLIPRPETEIMVEEIINTKQKNAIIIDLGTGSACIIISLAKNMSHNNTFYGLDYSSKALQVARKNIKNHNLENKIILHKSYLLKSILRKLEKTKKNIIIGANLPYLTTKEIKKSKTIQHEPLLALKAKNKGLSYYQELFIEIKTINCKKIQIYCEISPWQKKEIKKIASQILPNYKTKFKKDLEKKDRFFILSHQ